jgi:hypothetical protein
MNVFFLNMLIQLIAGAVGGNAAGALLKPFSLGPLGNFITGVIGGGLGGQLLSVLLAGSGASADGSAGGALAVGSLLTQVGGGGVGGIVLTVIVGLIRQALGGPGAQTRGGPKVT